MRITMNELEDLCNAAFTRLEEADLSVINFSENYYWSISFNEATYLAEKPDITMGALFADWEWLKEIISEQRRSMSTLDFERLGNLITALGNEFQHLPSKTPPDNWPIKIDDIKKICNIIFSEARTIRDRAFKDFEIATSSYWRVDLNKLYVDASVETPGITLQPFPTDIEGLTQHIKTSEKLSLEDFEQVGMFFKELGWAPEACFYSILDMLDQDDE